MRVSVDRLTKQFRDVRAVADLSLEIRDGEFMALLGPSGCGKTTTLLTIAGFYKPTSGTILFDGRVVDNVPPRDRNIGMVFQSYALYPHMTAHDNIAFPLKLRRVPRQERETRIKTVAAMLGIEDVLPRRPGEMSGGQQQRVALARALVKKPGLLLLDEPLSNLDAKLRIVMRAELKRLQKDLGITTIFVTHDQTEAMTMADRIAVQHQGALQQVGSPEDLYRRPANLFVAGFMGTPPMNFLDVSLEATGDALVLRRESFRFSLPDPLKQSLGHLVDRKLILGLRPEDIEIKPEEASQAEVYVVEPLGREALVTVKVPGAMLKVLAPPHIQLQAGTHVGWHVMPDRIYLFDAGTEEALLVPGS
ncbi:ABC transporter ATP-binding protein [Candidatus Bipolaricaulota bacterium]|nr:ABC transporter ATP-binding protein [Candidatus Bipolaricaulota bacterium]